MDVEPDGLIGLSRDEAQARAAAAGLSFRDMTPLPVDGVKWTITDDHRLGRLNMWFGQDGLAERAEVF